MSINTDYISMQVLNLFPSLETIIFEHNFPIILFGNLKQPDQSIFG